MNFNNIFFNKRYANGGPLFYKQSEIVNIYKELRLDKNENNLSESSFRTLVSKLTSNDRGLTEKLVPIFLEIVSSKINSISILEEVKGDMENAITNFKNKNLNDELDTIKLFADESQIYFQDCFKDNFAEHLMITDNPIEILETEESKRIKETIFENLLLFRYEEIKDFEQAIEQDLIKCVYEYYLTDEQIAIDLWKRFHSSLRYDPDFLKGKNIDEKYAQASDRLDLLCKYKKLRIYYTERIASSHNLYGYNVRSDSPRFFKFYVNYTNRIFFEIPRIALAGVFDGIYQPIRKKVESNKYIEHTFQHPNKFKEENNEFTE